MGWAADPGWVWTTRSPPSCFGFHACKAGAAVLISCVIAVKKVGDCIKQADTTPHDGYLLIDCIN